jgi:aspartate racemase
MKTIGLIGGMSWESTVTYYQIINQVVKEELGGFHSAKILLYSVDFHEIEACQSQEDWDKAAEILGEAALKLEHAGADFLIICTNTMHKVAPHIQTLVSIPIIHIAEATAEELTNNKMKKVALLGTKYTMKQAFYKDKLIAAGIDVLTPDDDDIELINRVIYSELCLGTISKESKEEFVRIIAKLAQRGVQGVVLGCTEIGLLIKQEDMVLPLFDTTQIHGTKAAMYAINK